MSKQILFVLIVAFLHVHASATPQHVCGHDTASTLQFSWCIDRAQVSSDDSNIILFLHGLNGSAASWSTDPSLGQLMKSHPGNRQPTVISISLGPVWLLSSRPGSFGTSTYSVFVDSMLPMVEKNLSVPVRSRILISESMGGFNALQLAARNAALFQKIAFVCPAFPALSPYADSVAVTNFLALHPETNSQLLSLEQSLGRQTFKSDTDYQFHSPQNLVSAMTAQSPLLFISAGTGDEFGFYPESADFAAKAARQGAQVTWVRIPNVGHCQQTSDSLKALSMFLNL